MAARGSYTDRPTAPSLYKDIQHTISIHSNADPFDSTSDLPQSAQQPDWPLPRRLKSPPKPASSRKNSVHDLNLNLNPEAQTHAAARQRMLSDCPILASITTNVVIEDEYILLTTLSHTLSTTYHRPEPSITLSIHHSSPLLHASSFDPAYILDISTHASLLLPPQNASVAAILAGGMQDVLGVPPSRGLIRFLPIPETCFAIGGKTLEIIVDELAEDAAEHRRAAEQRTIELRKTAGKRRSISALRNLSLLRPKAVAKTEPLFVCKEDEGEKSDGDEEMVYVAGSAGLGAVSKGEKDEKGRKLRSRKSFVSVLFGRAGVTV